MGHLPAPLASAPVAPTKPWETKAARKHAALIRASFAMIILSIA
jgi:hypothetical protein